MKTLSAVLTVLLACATTYAQTSVGAGSFRFSSGIHPTFTFVFEGTEAKAVESFWRDELKRISVDVINKKEIIGSGALLPQVSPDTVRVLVKADQRKGSPVVTAHVAVLSKAGWLGPDSDARAYDAAGSYVQDRSTELRRRIAELALENAEEQLVGLQRDLEALKKEHERMEGQIQKSNERAAEATTAQEDARKELDELEPRIVKQRATNASSPTEENQKELTDLMKQQTRLNDRLRKAQDEERNMKKRAEDLSWEVKKNVEDQGRKNEEVTAQEAVVKELRSKLSAIR